MTFVLKGCVKCNGDLHLERDTFGEYAQCLQCARIYENLEPIKKVPGVRQRNPFHGVNWGKIGC